MDKKILAWIVSIVGVVFIFAGLWAVFTYHASIMKWIAEHLPTRKVLVTAYPNSYQYVQKWHSILIDDTSADSVFSRYGLVYLRPTEYGNVYLNTITLQAFYLLDDGRIQSWFTGLRPIIDGKWTTGVGSCTTVNGLWIWGGNYPANMRRREFCALDGGRIDLAEVDFKNGVSLLLSHDTYPDYWHYVIQTPDGQFH